MGGRQIFHPDLFEFITTEFLLVITLMKAVCVEKGGFMGNKDKLELDKQKLKRFMKINSFNNAERYNFLSFINIFL